MALAQRQLDGLREDELHRVPLSRAARGGRLTARMTEPDAVSGRWALGMAVAWYAGLLQLSLTTPSAPRAGGEPVWAQLLHLGVFMMITAAAYGLARRSRAGMVASVAGGLVMMGLIVACPVSGHHEQVGAWWFGQLAAFTALTAAGLVGLVRSGSPHTAAAEPR